MAETTDLVEDPDGLSTPVLFGHGESFNGSALCRFVLREYRDLLGWPVGQLSHEFKALDPAQLFAFVQHVDAVTYDQVVSCFETLQEVPLLPGEWS